MRVAALGLFHEANTFSPLKADRDLYADDGVLRGDEIEAQHGGAATTMGGFLATTERWPDVKVVPLLFAFVNPIGPITRDAFESLVHEMLADVATQGPWDGVLLALHGAAVAEHLLDADGEIAQRVREIVGDDVPVGATFDLHANLSERLIEALTVANVYQTNPHVDARAQALACADLVVRCARREIHPVMVFEPVPLVVNIARQDTSEEPMSRLIDVARTLSRRPGMLSVSVVQGFPYADVPQMGMSCLAVHDGDAEEAERAAHELAAEVWASRAGLQTVGLTVEEALDLAQQAEEGPVVLLDVGDNVGGGAPGDSTVILEAALRRGLPSFVQTVWDPVAVEKCASVGAGATLELAVGARHGHSPGHPVQVAGRVRVIAQGSFEDPSPTHGGFRFFDMGRTAVLDTADGQTIVLTSKQMRSTSLAQLRCLGIEPAQYRVVVAKGVNSPRAAYRPVAKQLLVVDTDGITAMGVERFEYRNRRRPLYPFEPDAFTDALPLGH